MTDGPIERIETISGVRGFLCHAERAHRAVAFGRVLRTTALVTPGNGHKISGRFRPWTVAAHSHTVRGSFLWGKLGRGHF